MVEANSYDCQDPSDKQTGTDDDALRTGSGVRELWICEVHGIKAHLYRIANNITLIRCLGYSEDDQPKTGCSLI